MNAASTPLEELMAPRLGSIDPSRYPDELFDLYSIPSFDNGEPDIVAGKAIGSAKQIVEPGDVLLSRIVPHIRRAWVVGGARTRRVIASGEWIVFRSKRIDPNYLRHLLVSDQFHSQFMLTVSGVGGSLLRARSTYVSKIRVPLPSPAEQRRIADILNIADALRCKRNATLKQLDELSYSVFLDMFGDPAVNPRGYLKRSLASLVRDSDTINYGVVQPGDDLPDGISLIRVGDLLGGRVSHARLKRIAPSIEASYKRSRLRGDEILVSCVGTIGAVALADKTVQGFNIARAVARIPLADTTSRAYIAAYLRTPYVQHYFKNELRTVSQPTLNIKQLSETIVVCPPIELQAEFARRVGAIDNLRRAQSASLSHMSALFSSLESRVFSVSL